jgi:hypothetical protein
LGLRALRKLFRHFGYALEPIGGIPRDATDFECPLQARYSRIDPVFNVDLDKVRSSLHFGFGRRNWHPLMAALDAEERTKSVDEAISVLAQYYKSYQPASLAEYYFVNEPEWIEQAHLSTQPLTHHITPWLHESMPITAGHGFRKEDGGGAGGIGPISDRRLRWEIKHLIALRDSIRHNGYRPGGKNAHDIDGMFLRWRDEWRFLALDGKHRLAALTVLGHTRVRVRFASVLPRAVDLRDLEEWPGVVSGRFSVRVAREIFVRHFTETGHQKAARLGLTADRSGHRGEPGCLSHSPGVRVGASEVSCP